MLLRTEGNDLATQFKFLFKYQEESGEELTIAKKKGGLEKSLLCFQFFFTVPDQVAHRRIGRRLTKEVQYYSNRQHVNHIGFNCGWPR